MNTTTLETDENHTETETALIPEYLAFQENMKAALRIARTKVALQDPLKVSHATVSRVINGDIGGMNRFIRARLMEDVVKYLRHHGQEVRTPEEYAPPPPPPPERVFTYALPASPYQYVSPTEEQLDTISLLRMNFEVLHGIILGNVDNCRERDLALTKLEEVAMWANKAITHGEPG